ncbi:HU family DNA-binding protein [Streptomyces sp. NPDC048338]|uniref:HU family DNA-binding protein n=1 Tax=Streptomyces sp. NPDC048338 TaxID=3365536 RepID=UPI00371878C6
MSTIAHITGRLNTRLLGEAVAIELGINKEEGTAIVHTVLGIITRAVVAGHPVAITNFGTWIPVHSEARTARNPQTNTAMTIPARQELRFRPSDRLRALVAAENPAVASIRKKPKTAKTA